MPIYKTITVNTHTKVLIWKVEESEDELKQGIQLTESSQKRFDGMKSEVHRKGFLSIRQLLKAMDYQDADVHYDEKGKPHLRDEHYISMTHSFHFTAVILGKKEVGIDIEMQREKIKKIAPKFTPIEEYRKLGNGIDLIRKLTIVWGAKEALYKLYGKRGLLFLHDIFVYDFDFEAQQTYATVTYQGQKSDYRLHFMEFEGFTCVYAYNHL